MRDLIFLGLHDVRNINGIMQLLPASIVLGLLFLSIASLTIPYTHGWSIEGHQLITAHAIEMLPSPWRQFFTYYTSFLTEAATYPDTYYRADDPNEAQRHYVDLEVWTPNDPSTGTLPQSVEEFTLKMQSSIEASDWNAAFLIAGRVAHYVEDVAQPYHTTVNYNPTNKAGVGLHAVMDQSLMAHLSEINILTAPTQSVLVPTENLTNFVLDMASQSHSYLPIINRTLIDEELDWSPELTKIIENRGNAAIVAVARVWYTAITRTRVSAPDIPAINKLLIVVENISQTDNGLTSIRLRVVDSLGVLAYADVRLVSGSSAFRGQVADVFPPIGEYVVISETGLQHNDFLTAQREGYTSVTVTIGSLESMKPSSQSTIFHLPAITAVALVVMFGGIVALLVFRRLPTDS